MWRNQKAQSTVEYAVLIAIVIGALLAMQIFVKRGVMGKLRGSTDQVGDQFTPLNTTSHFVTAFDGVRRESTEPTGVSNSDITREEVSDRTGDEHVTTALDTEALYQ